MNSKSIDKDYYGNDSKWDELLADIEVGPQKHEEEAKAQRIAAAEYMIRSLPHFNNEVRRLSDEVEDYVRKLQKLYKQNEKAKLKGEQVREVKPLQKKLGNAREDLKMYSDIRNKVLMFLDTVEAEYHKAMMDIFVKNKTYKNVSMEMNSDDSTLHRQIRKILAKFY